MTIPSSIIYFPAYEYSTEILKSQFPLGQYTIPLFAGVTARIFTLFFTSLLEMIRTNLQATSGTINKEETISKTIKNTIRTNGVVSLWRVFIPTIFRDAPFSAIYWVGLENLRSYMGGSDSFKNNFISGWVSGSFAAIITNPIDVVKTRRQGDSQNIKRTGWQIFQLLLKEEGVRGLTRGMFPRVARVGPSCAIMISAYEYVKRFTR